MMFYEKVTGSFQYKVGDGETALNLRFLKPESILFLCTHLIEKLKVLLCQSL